MCNSALRASSDRKMKVVEKDTTKILSSPLHGISAVVNVIDLD